MAKKKTRARKPPASALATIEEAIDEFRQGRFVIITDNEDRENEGDLTLPAQFVDAQAINFMAKYARGLICMPMSVPTSMPKAVWIRGGKPPPLTILSLQRAWGVIFIFCRGTRMDPG